jgi:hypothetical protein
VSRAIQYYNGRQALPADVPDPLIAEAGITAAEDAIVAGDDPLKAVADVLRGQEPQDAAQSAFDASQTEIRAEAERRKAAIDVALEASRRAMADGATPEEAAQAGKVAAQEFMAGAPDQRVREPLIPDEVPESVTPEPTPLAPNPITTTPLDAPKAPKGKKPTDLSTFVVRSGGIFKGDDKGEIAQLEYKRSGFIKKTLFERSSAGDNGGGRRLDELREMAVEQGYLPEGATLNDFIDALSEDTKGRKVYSQRDLGDAIARQQEANDARFSPDYVDEVTQYRAKEPADDGFFVRRSDYDPLEEDDFWHTRMAAKFDEWLATTSFPKLLPREREEILQQLRKDGGEAKDLLERVLSRELEGFEYEALGIRRGKDGEETFIPFGDETDALDGQARADGGPSGQPEAAPGNAAAGGEGAGRVPGPAVEQTQAGSQYLAPGVAPLTAQERLAPRANARMGEGAQRERDSQIGGLFDPNDKVRTDMFSDPASPKAQAHLDGKLLDLKAALDAEGDMPVGFTATSLFGRERWAGLTADDGRKLESLSDVIQEIEDFDALAREVALCRTGGPNVAE